MVRNTRSLRPGPASSFTETRLSASTGSAIKAVNIAMSTSRVLSLVQKQVTRSSAATVVARNGVRPTTGCLPGAANGRIEGERDGRIRLRWQRKVILPRTPPVSDGSSRSQEKTEAQDRSTAKMVEEDAPTHRQPILLSFSRVSTIPTNKLHVCSTNVKQVGCLRPPRKGEVVLFAFAQQT